MNKVQISVVSTLLGMLLITGAFALDNIVHGISPFSEYEVINGLKSEQLMKEQVLQQAIQDLNFQVDSLQHTLNTQHCVTATNYYPTGDEMRSGKLIPQHYTLSSAEVKYVAISQDLWDRNGGPYSFGDTIHISGTPYDGFYVIQDTMNKRWKNRIDILIESKSRVREKWMNVKIWKV